MPLQSLVNRPRSDYSPGMRHRAQSAQNTIKVARRLGRVLALLVVGPCCQSAPSPETSSSQQSDRPIAEEKREGSPAPDVELHLEDGTTKRLHDYRGKQVVLYFYPKDQTRGCTIEAQGFRDAHGSLLANDVVVLGVSLQGVESHRAFVEKENLPFHLVADTSGAVARAFGVDLNGGDHAARDTVWIDPQGNVARIWRNVSPQAHAQAVLAAISDGDTPRKQE